MIDNLDAKMGMVQRALRQSGDEEFSERLPGLSTILLTRKLPSASTSDSDELKLEGQ